MTAQHGGGGGGGNQPGVLDKNRGMGRRNEAVAVPSRNAAEIRAGTVESE